MPLTNEQKNRWYKIPNQSLAVFMRDSGFDLSVYDMYSKEVKKEARKLAVKKAIEYLNDSFLEQTDCELKEIRFGVYVIRLSGNISVEYQHAHSPVIYIGQGNVLGRLQSHYESKLFEFMQSLSGANFDFYICEPWKSHHRKKDFHKQIEFSMISDFTENFGGVNDQHCFPLMNKISGSDRGLDTGGNWWRTPLKRTKMKTTWILRPGPNSEFVGALK